MPLKKQKKTNFFRQVYKESWQYIKDSKNFIYSSIGIFILFALLGFFIPAPASIQKQILQFIQDLLDKTKGMSQGQLITYIFFNNTQTSFMSTFFGIFLGIFPVITTIANGYLLGFVSVATVKQYGIFILWKLLPHGIFELPALFISLGMGIKLGTIVFNKKIKETTKSYLINSAKVFVFVVIPLLLIAAVIEGTLIYLLG